MKCKQFSEPQSGKLIKPIFTIIHFHYCDPLNSLFDGLSSDWNQYHMQTFFHGEVDIPTYSFGVHNTIGVSSTNVMF